MRASIDPTEYDLVIVGGGLGGAALAFAMARHGSRVLVVERETAFKDRVRGEGMTPWGVAEARALRIYEGLREACGLEIRQWDARIGPMRVERDLVETTPQQAPVLDFSHPHMQEVLLGMAAGAGAEVRRGAHVTAVIAGEVPRVGIEHEGVTTEVSTRMVVGADGRGSRVRGWAGFAVHKDPPRLLIGGVLLEGTRVPTDRMSLFQSIGRTAIFYPQRHDRVRAYAVYHRDLLATRLQGEGDLPRFFEIATLAGAPEPWLAGSRAVGPLATFEGADAWAEHPYRQGVALVGDAAATSDPSWGQGLSLTLRDVRTLRDALLRSDDWDVAGHAYAAEHDGYYQTLHAVEDWQTRLFMEVDAAADARRQRALPLLMEDGSRMPDVLLSGPERPLGEEDRIRFIGE
jgi:2-polyprenyl-6-methoxyphenol hydroxylase-like FAD-dependent oxidoreductase